MKSIIFSIIILNFSFCFLWSQESIVNDGDLPESEFHVVMNPLDTNHIVLASIHGFGNMSNGNDIVIYYSFDAGKTWTKSDYNAVSEGFSASGDPVLAFDTKGDLLLVNLVGYFTADSVKVDNILSRSQNGGMSWTKVADVVNTEFSDKPWISVDSNVNSAQYGNIYIPSVDNDINLHVLNSEFEEITKTVIPNGDALPSVVVKSNGDIFTSTIELSNNVNIYVQKFTDGGENLVFSKRIVSIPDFTFKAPWISNRFQPTAYLAIDNSGGEYDGRIYMGYTGSEDVDPKYFDIFLMYSDDDGETWTTPSVVNQDNLDKNQQYYSSLYVNNNGVLIMDWYDRRNYSDENKFTDFYLGISKDGGESFEELQLNSTYSDFQHVISSSGGFGIGEYHQVIASDHTAYSFWSDGRKNNMDLNIYMAKVSLGDPTAVKEINTISPEIRIVSVFPNPIKDKLMVDMNLKSKTKLKMEVFSISGALIWNNMMTEYSIGDHSVLIPLDNLTSGSYMLKIIDDNGYLNLRKIIKQ